jgi:transcriptional regulator with XRE-family HTH domain
METTMLNMPLKIRILETFPSQAVFAEVLGVDDTLVSRVVRGRRLLSLSLQDRWAKALGCTRQEIFPDHASDQGA